MRWKRVTLESHEQREGWGEKEREGERRRGKERGGERRRGVGSGQRRRGVGREGLASLKGMI